MMNGCRKNDDVVVGEIRVDGGLATGFNAIL
jgi:hypothetical protein